MEYSLLSPHDLTLKQGIPFHLVRGLAKTGKYHDANLHWGYDRNEEVKYINQMEASLGTLSAEQIELRIIADFCCIWRYDYPERIHQICATISGSPKRELRLHFQVGPDQRQRLSDYAAALKGWLDDIAPDDPAYFREGSSDINEKVYSYLGQKDPLKNVLAERTFISLASRFLNCSFWGESNSDSGVSLFPYTAYTLPANSSQRMHELEQRMKKEMGNQAYNFICDVGGSPEPACYFKFIRRVEIMISSIGAMKWRGNLPPKDSLISNRKYLTKLYMDVLEKYWRESKTSYANTEGESIEKELFDLLGKPDDFKKWLVACLWRSIQIQTTCQAYPMKQWVEFVRIGEDYLHNLERQQRKG